MVTPSLPEHPDHATEVHNNLREQIESVQPGDSGVIDRVQLGLTAAEFASLLVLLRDLEQAGTVRLGDLSSADRVEFERLR